MVPLALGALEGGSYGTLGCTHVQKGSQEGHSRPQPVGQTMVCRMAALTQAGAGARSTASTRTAWSDSHAGARRLQPTGFTDSARSTASGRSIMARYLAEPDADADAARMLSVGDALAVEPRWRQTTSSMHGADPTSAHTRTSAVDIVSALEHARSSLADARKIWAGGVGDELTGSVQLHDGNHLSSLDGSSTNSHLSWGPFEPVPPSARAVLAASATTSDSRATHTAQTPGRSRHAALVSAVGADAEERDVRDEQAGAAVGLELALHLARLGVAGAGPDNNEIHTRLWQLKLERESEERSRAETHRFSETFDSHLSLRSGAVRCAAHAQWVLYRLRHKTGECTHCQSRSALPSGPKPEAHVRSRESWASCRCALACAQYLLAFARRDCRPGTAHAEHLLEEGVAAGALAHTGAVGSAVGSASGSASGNPSKSCSSRSASHHSVSLGSDKRTAVSSIVSRTHTAQATAAQPHFDCGASCTRHWVLLIIIWALLPGQARRPLGLGIRLAWSRAVFFAGTQVDAEIQRLNAEPTDSVDLEASVLCTTASSSLIRANE
jgi:hypothetical protein